MHDSSHRISNARRPANDSGVTATLGQILRATRAEPLKIKVLSVALAASACAR
jgi:hypothetical protein